MDINGLPAHVLVVHGAVVFAPLAALAAILLAVVPRWRYLTRWPALALALVATGTVWLARVSGEDFFESRFASLPADSPVLVAIREHEERGETLSLVVLGLLVATAAGASLLGGASGFASGRGAKGRAAPWLETVLPIVIVLVSLATLVYAFLAGDAGARATWGQQG